MHRNLRLTIVLMLLGIGGLLPKIVKAQTNKLLTLEEAVELSISHSRQLKIDSTQLQIATAKIKQSINNQLPQVGINLSYVRISDNITPFKVSFSTGEIVLNPQILNQSYNSLQIRQPIFLGGKIKNVTELLKLDRQVIYFDIEKNKSDAAFNITTLWYNLFVVKETKKIIEANIKVLKNQQKDAQNFVTQGIILANDVLKIDLAITNIQSTLIDLENSMRLLKYNLCLLTGLDTKLEIDIPDSISFTTKQTAGLNDYLLTAMKNRPELKGVNIRQRQAALGLKLAKGDYLPNLSLGGNANYNQPEQRVFPNKAELTSTWNAGAYLSWNLSTFYTNKQKISESKLNITRVTQVLEQVTEGIQLEVNTDYTNYLNTSEKISIATKEVEQATENFRVEQNRFSNKTTTPTEFLTANTLLLQSKINLSTATANSELAYKKLLKSTNSNN